MKCNATLCRALLKRDIIMGEVRKELVDQLGKVAKVNLNPDSTPGKYNCKGKCCPTDRIRRRKEVQFGSKTKFCCHVLTYLKKTYPCIYCDHL